MNAVSNGAIIPDFNTDLYTPASYNIALTDSGTAPDKPFWVERALTLRHLDNTHNFDHPESLYPENDTRYLTMKANTVAMITQ